MDTTGVKLKAPADSVTRPFPGSLKPATTKERNTNLPSDIPKPAATGTTTKPTTRPIF
jgi:hypothetical protein